MPSCRPERWTRLIRSPWLAWGIGGGAVFSDQAIKVHAEAAYLLSPPVPSMSFHRSSAEVFFSVGSLDGAFLRFNLTHVANAGVMLGALEDSPSPIPWLAFMTATGIGFAIALRLFLAAKPHDVALRAGALLLAAGVLGNLIDRVRLGYVVDWAHMQWQVLGWRYSAPAFNLADLFMIVGATLAGAALAGRWATSRGHIRARSIST